MVMMLLLLLVISPCVCIDCASEPAVSELILTMIRAQGGGGGAGDCPCHRPDLHRQHGAEAGADGGAHQPRGAVEDDRQGQREAQRGR